MEASEVTSLDGLVKPVIVRMHPLTLVFDDEALEWQIRAERSAVASQLLVVFGIFGFGFSLCTPHGFTWWLTGMTVLPLVSFVFTASKHGYLSALWMISWTANVFIWWWLLWTGLVQRLGPDEGHAIAATCGGYIFACIVQRVMHFSVRYRVSFFCITMPICCTSPNWAYLLVMALIAGDALGHVLENMLRDAFLRRIQSTNAVRAQMEHMLSESTRHSTNLEIARREELIHRRLRPSTGGPQRCEPYPRASKDARITSMLETVVSSDDES